MKLLVSCPRRVLLVDTQDRSVRVVEAGRPEYYGISWTPDGEHLCLSHSGVEDASLGTLESYIDSERGWVSLGGRAGGPCLSAPHQLVCAGDRVVATNTGRNCLTVFRAADFFYRNVWLDDVRWDRRGRQDFCGSHFNSVTVRGDRVHVLAHNFDRGSYLATLSWPDLDPVDRRPCPVRHAHNVWPQPGGPTVTCDSQHGRLVDALSGEVLWDSGAAAAFTRGLAAAGDLVFVGKSAHSRPAGRPTTDGGVWVVDRRTWRTVEFIPLPASGSVHEVRVVDAPDECHHGHPLLRLPEADDAATAAYLDLARRAGRAKAAPATLTLPVRQSWAGPPGGALPDGWVAAQGAFARADGWLASPPEAPDTSVAAAGGVEAGDVRVAAEVEVAGGGDRSAGVLARYRGPGDANAYLAALISQDGRRSVDLWRHAGRCWELLRSAPVGVASGRLSLEARGRRLAVTFDGDLLHQVDDPAPLPPGAVGVRAAGGRVREFRAASLAAPAAGARRFRVGIWCDYGRTLTPTEGIGVYVHNLAAALLDADPSVELTLVARDGEQHVMGHLRDRAPDRVRVLPDAGSPFAVRGLTARAARQWYRASEDVRQAAAGWRLWGNGAAARVRRSVLGLLRRSWRGGPAGRAGVAAALPALGLLAWAADGAAAVAGGAARVAGFPLAAADAVARKVWTRAQVYPAEVVRSVMAGAGCDVWVIPYVGFEYPLEVPAVVFVHDLVSYHHPDGFDPIALRRLKQIVPDRVREATVCACMSEFIRTNDLRGVLGLPDDKVRMVRPAAPRDLPRVDPDEARRLRPRRLRRPYLLVPAAFRPYKNHRVLLDALHRLAARREALDLDLVFTGAAADLLPPELDALAARYRLRDRVHVLGRVDRKTLAVLYAGAEATVMPTLYEQGSFPIYEALASGCPVACSDIPALREQCAPMGDAMLYFDPRDPEAVARTVARIHADPDGLRHVQRAAGRALWVRTWTEVAEDWLAVFREAAARGRKGGAAAGAA